MKSALLAICLLPMLAVAACAETNPSGIQSILLYPNGTIQLDRTDRCDVVTNTTSNTLVYLPTPADAWKNFAAAHYPSVSIKDCNKR